MPSERVTLGKSDLTVFPLNLGGNVFGWTADTDASIAVLDAFEAGGGNFIDTADVYSAWAPGHTGGESETVIGQWMSARGNRSNTVIATKVASHPEFKGLSPANLPAAADASLKRLGTDYIDLYYAHTEDPETPLEETVEAFSKLVDAGKIRYIGLSNHSPENTEKWLSIAAENGLHAPIALQPHYNLVEREFETTLRPVAEKAGLAVLPYWALASGFLTGKYRDGSTADSARSDGTSKYLDDRGRQVLAALDEVAAAHSASVTSVALAWLAAQPTVAAPIASARKVEQLPDLLASVSLTLAKDELAALSAASESSDVAA